MAFPLFDSWHEMKTTCGQELDIWNPAEEASVGRVVEHKSAPFYGCALHLGRLYGEMIQIHDYLNDTMALPASPSCGNSSKPWA